MKTMTIQRDKRIRRPRNAFSPSDNFNRSTHYLLYFGSTNSYNIVFRSSISSVNDETATLYVHGQKTTATIITSGTLEICEAEQRRRTRLSQQTSEDDDEEELNADENECISMHSSSQQEGLIDTFSLPSRQPTTVSKNRTRPSIAEESASSNSDSEVDTEPLSHRSNRFSHSNGPFNSIQKPTATKNKREHYFAADKSSKRQRTSALSGHHEHDEQVNGLADGTISNNNNDNNRSKADVLNQIQNHLVVFEILFKKSLQKMEKKIDAQISSNFIQGSVTLDQYRSQSPQHFPNEYIYNGQDLLSTTAKGLLDFCRNTLKLIFTQEELRTHVLPPQRDHLKRSALDEQRFNIFLEAVRIKFRLDSDLFQRCYHDLIKTKLSNFLYEERRRESRRIIRHRECELKKKVIQENQYNNQHSLAEGDGAAEEERCEERNTFIDQQ